MPVPPQTSLSARRAWIEIFYCLCGAAWYLVALRKESVDRNIAWIAETLKHNVALRKESVDRNALTLTYEDMWLPSLSARRAWIEISTALRPAANKWSLSARRAWIEMAAVSALDAPWAGRSPQGERG